MNQIFKRFMSSNLEYISKKRKIVSDLLKKRADDQKLRKNVSINSACIQVLGDGTQGSFPSLLLNSEGRSYLFNCGAGFQRSCFTNRIRLTGLEHIFLTSIKSDSIAGIYGLSLTVTDIGLPSLCIHSSEKVNGLFKSMKEFTVATGMKLSERRYPPGFHNDNGLDVTPIIIEGISSAVETKSTMNPEVIIAYVCSLPDVPGALNPLKCKELKVPVGPMLAKLKSGQDISLEDGTIVRSCDVCEPKQRGLRFLVVECPTEDNLESFRTNPQLQKVIRESLQQGKELDLIFHLSPCEVTKNTRYQDWMETFKHQCTKHLMISHKESDRIHLLDFRRNQYFLNKLDESIFPPPYFEPKLKDLVHTDLQVPRKGPISRILKPSEYEDHFEHKDIRYMITNQLETLPRVQNLFFQDRLVLKPKKYLETPEDKLDLGATFREVSDFENFNSLYNDLKGIQKKFPQSEDHEPEVVFLGTGSAVPSKYRNTSGILVNFSYPKPKSVILDCGEDTYGQLIRYYGPRRTQEILRNLKLIYISHFHADHHVGLMQLLQKRSQLTDERLALLAPPGVISLIDYHNNNIQDISGSYELYKTNLMRTFRDTRDCYEDISKKYKSSLYDMTSGFVDDVKLVEADHCAYACAAVIKFKFDHPKMKTFSIAYSGDCRPCDMFVEIGRNCDLLIHEGTMDDRNQLDAEMKKHCTIGEAIEISRRMNPKYTILTHFSQRLVKIPMFTSDFNDKIGFSFDFLRIKCPSHYGRLDVLRPILNLAYRDSIEMIETKFLREHEKRLVTEALRKEASTSVK